MQKVNLFYINQLPTKFVVNNKFPSLITFSIYSYTLLMEFGRYPNRLKRYRRIAGYSQKKVARLLGFLDTSSLSRWEHGITVPHIVNIFRLASLYHAKPEELYSELWDQIAADQNLLARDEPIDSQEGFYL